MFCTAVADEPAEQAHELLLCAANESGSLRDQEIIPTARAPSEQRRRPDGSEAELDQCPLLGERRLAHVRAVNRLRPSPAARPARCSPAESCVPGGITSSARAPAVAMTRAAPSSASTIAIRSKGTSPRSSRMKAPNASSRSSDEPSARAQRFAASSRSAVASELVAKRLCLLGTAHRGRALLAETRDEPAHEQRHQQADARLERDVVRPVTCRRRSRARSCSNQASHRRPTRAPGRCRAGEAEARALPRRRRGRAAGASASPARSEQRACNAETTAESNASAASRRAPA